MNTFGQQAEARAAGPPSSLHAELRSLSVATLLTRKAGLELTLRQGQASSHIYTEYWAYQREVIERCEPPKRSKSRPVINLFGFTF